MSTPSLTEFLLARIAEDEASARAASPSPWSYGDVDSVAGGMLYDQTRTIAGVYYEQPEDHDGSIVRHMLVPEADANGAHIARHDPARVLAECEAKRRIVETAADYVAEFGNESWRTDDSVTAGRVAGRAREWEAETLRLLALPYADHPDYDEEWKP